MYSQDENKICQQEMINDSRIFMRCFYTLKACKASPPKLTNFEYAQYYGQCLGEYEPHPCLRMVQEHMPKPIRT